MARCATGDWDAVVITRSAFERIPVSDATRRAFLRGTPASLSLTELELRQADPGGLVQRLEHRLRALETGRDDGRIELTRSLSEAMMARSRLGQAFEHEPRLNVLLGRQAEIVAALATETSSDIGRSGPVPSSALAPAPRHELSIER